LLLGSEITFLTPRLHFCSHSAPYLNKIQEELMQYLTGKAQFIERTEPIVIYPDFFFSQTIHGYSLNPLREGGFPSFGREALKKDAVRTERTVSLSR